MKNKHWATLMLVGVLSRLVVTNGGPAGLRLQSHPSKFSHVWCGVVCLLAAPRVQLFAS